jgi:hypothetical protein
MSRILVLLCFVILVCFTTTARAADIIAKSCSNSAVQTAINSAVNGDRVLIPAGRCNWTTQVTIPSTKGITLQGAGIGVTTILSGEADGVPSGALIVNVKSGNSLTRVTAFTMDENSLIRPSQSAAISILGDGLDAFRIDHILLDNVAKRGLSSFGSFRGYTELSGLIDHVTCNAAPNTSVQCFGPRGSQQADGFGAFEFPVQLGSNHQTYFEDCTCNFTSSADECLDAFTGASFVFRYNTMSGISIGVHGADSALRGMHTVEVYRNTFSNTGSLKYMANWRSGPNVMFDNVYTGAFTNVIFTLYRVDEPYGVNGKCDGTNPRDKNLVRSGQPDQGYPCLDQTGWYFHGAAPHGSAAIHTPAYVFNNTLNGMATAPTTNTVGSTPTAPYVVGNRDYYNDVGASCSGVSCKTGVGIGPLSSRPANCTEGVGYWATDQGTWNKAGRENGVLYKCTATNTWTLYYTPYTYPHPLQSVQDNSPPPVRPRGLNVQ